MFTRVWQGSVPYKDCLECLFRTTSHFFATSADSFGPLKYRAWPSKLENTRSKLISPACLLLWNVQLTSFLDSRAPSDTNITTYCMVVGVCFYQKQCRGRQLCRSRCSLVKLSEPIGFYTLYLDDKTAFSQPLGWTQNLVPMSTQDTEAVTWERNATLASDSMSN